jgi:hypothetical protein
MTLQTTADRTVRRPALVGFALGFVLTFVVTLLALMLTAAERLEDVLVPARVLLAPWRDPMASWNGLLTMVVAGTVNGLVYAAAFAVVAAAAGVVRRSRA